MRKAFRLQEIESIIDKYLNLYTYYQSLQKILLLEKQYTNPPLYTLHTIQNCLHSEPFLSSIPPYMNSLMTTTNIGIIVQTLRILSRIENKQQRINSLNRIVKVINVFTLYQIQHNETYVVCDCIIINKVLWAIGIAITHQQFQYYLNNVWDDEKVGNQRVLQIYQLLEICVLADTIEKMKAELSTLIAKDNYDSPPKRQQKSLYPSKTVKIVDYDENDEKMKSLKIRCYRPRELIHEVQNARKNSTKLKNKKSKTLFQKKEQNKQYSSPQKQEKTEEPEQIEKKYEDLNILNGYSIRDEIRKEVENGKIIIVDNYDMAINHALAKKSTKKIASRRMGEKQIKKGLKWEYRNENFVNIAQKIFH